MTTTKKTSNPAPLAHRIPAEVSPVITAYAEWLTEQTGYKVDPMSVYIGSQLRSTFQKTPANQARLQTAAKERAAQDAVKAARKAEREAAAKAKAAEPKVAPAKPAPKAAPNVAPKKVAPKRPIKVATKAGSTIATAEGVVIAEQKHVEAVQA